MFIQRGVGRVGRNVVPLLIGIAGVTVAAVLGAGQGRYGPFPLVAGAFGAFGLFFGLFPIVVWHGVLVRIDDSGVLFGSSRPLRRPPVPFSALRQPYFAPWGAFVDVHVIEGRAAARAMRKSVAPMVTHYNGFFPRAGATAHLSFIVDARAVTLPWQRTYTSGVWTIKSHPTPMNPSIVWVFPIRDVEGTIEALQAHGVEVVRDDKPAVAMPRWPADALTPPPRT